VFGGSFAGLLVMWRLHGIDTALRTAWQAGVVLTGTSAGSICWHVGGTTGSFVPQLQAVTDGLGCVPYANGVHYDSEDPDRCCTAWSAMGSCPRRMPPTMALACCISAPNLSRRSLRRPTQ
jgi:peptidase E